MPSRKKITKHSDKIEEKLNTPKSVRSKAKLTKLEKRKEKAARLRQSMYSFIIG